MCIQYAATGCFLATFSYASNDGEGALYVPAALLQWTIGSGWILDGTGYA